MPTTRISAASAREPAADGKRRSQIRSSTLAKVLLWIALALLVWRASTLLLLAFAGVLIALLLDSVARWLGAHTRVPRGGAVAIAVLLLVATTAGAVWLLAGELVAQIDQMLDRLPQYMERAERFARSAPLGRRLLEAMGVAEDGQSAQALGALLEHGGAAAISLATFVGNALLVLAVGIFLVASPATYREGVISLAPPARRPRIALILDACDHNLRWWLVGQLVVMLILGAMTTLGLWALGMPFALTLGVAAMVLSFIPYFGPILSFLPALLIALGEPGAMVGYVCALYAVVQLCETYAITPLVQQRVLRTPPALAILFQILAAIALGAAGLMLAMPLLVTIVIVVKIGLVSARYGDRVEIPGLAPERLPV